MELLSDLHLISGGLAIGFTTVSAISALGVDPTPSTCLGVVATLSHIYLGTIIKKSTCYCYCYFT